MFEFENQNVLVQEKLVKYHVFSLELNIKKEKKSITFLSFKEKKSSKKKREKEKRKRNMFLKLLWKEWCEE